MKKAYELSTLTGTQVLLLVASETGHVYTFATPKLQPIIAEPEGKNMIQQCLNTPDRPESTPPQVNRAQYTSSPAPSAPSTMPLRQFDSFKDEEPVPYPIMYQDHHNVDVYPQMYNPMMNNYMNGRGSPAMNGRASPAMHPGLMRVSSPAQMLREAPMMHREDFHPNQ